MEKERSLNMIVASEYPHLKKEGQDKILKSLIEQPDPSENRVTDEEIIKNDRARLRSLLRMG